MKLATLRKMIDISKLYYEKNLTQEEIAKKFEISIPQVSRIIASAKKNGYVKTLVVDPFSESDDITKQLMTTFNLKDARIVKSSYKDMRVTDTNAAQAGADYLLDIVQANDIVSIAYSNTIYKIPQFLPKVHIENLSLVQPNGILFEHVKGYQYDTIREISNKTDAYYYYFPAPAFVENKEMKESLHKDPIISWVMNKAEQSNISFFSVANPSIESRYVRNGYFTAKDMMKIQNNGSVGEIFGHFINSNGELNDQILEDRVLGMGIDRLREKDYSVCISAGDHLVNAIYATLEGKYCNVLITDSATARKLIERKSSSTE